MNKDCTVCKKPFTTRDSRHKTCSMECANISRARNAGPAVVTVNKPTVTELPDVEQLPAAYVKRCHDLWVSLTDGNVPKRIA
jgi:hypothetical protein